VSAFLIAWIALNFMHLRLNRRQALAVADENRAYVTSLAGFVPGAKDVRQFIWDGRPFALHPWGIKGALGCLYGTNAIDLFGMEDAEAQAALRGDRPLAILSWDMMARQLTVTARRSGSPDASYIRMGRATPIWQLDDGWYPLEGAYRWSKPHATAHLERPAGARAFELRVNISPDVIRDTGGTEARVFLAGELIGKAGFAANGWQTVRWTVPPGPSGRVEVRIESPPYRPSNNDPRVLGLAVVSFGFVE
jgi:hypothetical protein